MPTSTDLVTDLPADFEVFGQAVDTSMADLKGGTTGQILSKASNTNMDFTWTTPNPGDITAVTAGTGITGGGTSGAVTVNVDPTYAGFTNLNYIANPVLNSAANVWQRGTSIAVAASSTAYTADRWYIATNANQAVTVSRQATSDTTNLAFIQYCQRIQRNSGQTGTGAIYESQFFENINSTPFIGKTITFSFYARAGANFSATSNALEFYVQTGTGTDQGAGAWTGQASAIATTGTLTTTWQRFTATATIPTSATQIKVITGWTPTGTAGTNDYYELTGVQMDVGSVALPFRTNGSTYALELAACQRYYYRNTQAASGVAITNNGGSVTTTIAETNTKLPVTMRVAPNSMDTSSIAWYNYANTTVYSSGTLAMQSTTPDFITVRYTHGSAIFTAGQVGVIVTTTPGYIGFSAEL
jgi:hypothetical protein